MPASWGEIFPELMRAKLIATRGIKDRLLALDDPLGVIATCKNVGLEGGQLTDEVLDRLIAAHSPTPKPSMRDTIGRTIAPINEPEPLTIQFRNNLPDWRKEDFPMDATDCDVDLLVHYDITGNSITEGKMSDINATFSNRLERLRKMIIKNSNLPRSPMEIARLQAEKSRFKGRGNIAVAIGLVNEPRHTKNGHLMFALEDNSGEMSCLLMNRQGDDRIREHIPIIEAGLMPDDVVGVSGTFSQNGDMFYVDDLHFPMQDKHEKSYSEQGVSVAFLSDIHVGSKTFLEAQWHKMVNWFHSDPLARTIKYLILSGDCVDGVGIYPGQDKELAIKDLYKQYSRFAELLELLPEWVECVMLPGNHDAVRPAEPQPTLEPDIQQDFNTTTFVGNPCDFSLHGVRLLSYHGKSIDDFVAGLRTVTYSDPVEAMRQMLRRRHLAPQWGGKTPLSPEPEDGLVIREVPDIFVTGHVHGHECIDFRGTTLICSSTWQDQTSYQKMLGFQPKPCMLTVVNLGTHQTTAIPFA
jgi:DNA polymerase II small subunit